MFGKSQNIIDQRRDVKRRVVEIMVQCAEIGPIAITGNGILNGEQVGRITVLVAHNFVNTLKAEDIDALKTAKGCRQPPPGLEDPSRRTLYEHIMTPTKSVSDAGCMAAFVHDGVLWAKQVAQANPNSNINWPSYEVRIKSALNQLKVSNKQYFMNPGLRDPQDSNQALYWLVYHAGQLDGKPNAEIQFRQKFQSLPKELRNNANLQAFSNNYAKAVSLFEKYYVDMDFPDEFK